MQVLVAPKGQNAGNKPNAYVPSLLRYAFSNEDDPLARVDWPLMNSLIPVESFTGRMETKHPRRIEAHHPYTSKYLLKYLRSGSV